MTQATARQRKARQWAGTDLVIHAVKIQDVREQEGKGHAR